MCGSRGQWPISAIPCMGTMVYWHEETGLATAGKQRSAACSETKVKLMNAH